MTGASSASATSAAAASSMDDMSSMSELVRFRAFVGDGAASRASGFCAGSGNNSSVSMRDVRFVFVGDAGAGGASAAPSTFAAARARTRSDDLTKRLSRIAVCARVRRTSCSSSVRVVRANSDDPRSRCDRPWQPPPATRSAARKTASHSPMASPTRGRCSNRKAQADTAMCQSVCIDATWAATSASSSAPSAGAPSSAMVLGSVRVGGSLSAVHRWFSLGARRGQPLSGCGIDGGKQELAKVNEGRLKKLILEPRAAAPPRP